MKGRMYPVHCRHGEAGLSLGAVRSFVLAASLLASSALFSCGTTATTCSAVNCAGCCTADGQCADGTANDSCGSGALLCNTCSGGQTCSDRRCVSLRSSTRAPTPAR